MRSLLFAIIAATVFAGPPWIAMARASAETKAMIGEVTRLAGKDDFLGARIVIRKMEPMTLERGEWLEVRRWIHRQPRLGRDLVQEWENVDPLAKRRAQNPAQNRARATKGIHSEIERTEALFAGKKFEEAFSVYQKIARALKKDFARGNDLNVELYFSILHRMGQSLYASGRFQDALTVYEWIPSTYFSYRQVLFEKMWAAFRAGKIAQANGAIASQYSSYMGSFPEPEAFLVQIYVYRKLCRQKDLSLVLGTAKMFDKNLREGAWGVDDWALSDLHTRALLLLARQEEAPNSAFVTMEDRARERERIRGRLEEEFAAEKKRLLNELGRVFAFGRLAFSSTSKELPPLEKLPSHEELLRSGREMWPVEDGEDWLDEMGNHVFIGESQCASGPESKE